MSTIYSTRRGFLYQDRFAVLTYLTHLESQDIKEFYVDYPLLRQKSLDVRLITRQGQEKVYEVKTGESFKRDTSTGESTEIRDALLDLLDYRDNKSPDELQLVVSPKFQHEVVEYWARLTRLRGAASLREARTKEAANWLIERLHNSKLDTQRKIFDTCKTIIICESYSDQADNANDEFCPIEDQIISKIENIAGHLDGAMARSEVPAYLAMFELGHKCQQYAGTESDISAELDKVLVNLVVSRKIYDAIKRPPHTGLGRGVTLREVEQELVSWKTASPATPRLPLGSMTSDEGVAQ